MDYVAEPAKFDEVVEDKGVQIVVDAKAVLLDYKKRRGLHDQI